MATSGYVRPLAPTAITPRQQVGLVDRLALADVARGRVAELGVLQPILVRPAGDGEYELIAGERRWRASKRAGLQTIPVVVRDADTDASLLEQALVENLHRADLNPMEEAAAYQQLIEDFGLTLGDRLLTDEAPRLAEPRLAYMRGFLEQLRSELPPGTQP